MTTDTPVTYEVRDQVAHITLNRPSRRNAITGPLGVALAEAFEAAQDDGDVNAVLFSGAGGAFCSGLDLGEFSADPKPDWMAEWPALWRRAHKAIFACEKPIVGALERFAINGGAALMLACDFVVAGETAFLHVGEVQIGMAAPYNLAWLRLKHSEAVCMQLAMLGERVEGTSLVTLGVAHTAVPDTAVREHASALAAQLAGYPNRAAPRIKRGLRKTTDVDMDAYFDRAWSAASGGAKPPPKKS